MAKTKELTMVTPPQTLAEPIRAGEFQNLSAAQIERITRIWDKIERHAPMTQQEMLALFDSRPGSIENDIHAFEDVLFVFSNFFQESAQPSEKSEQYAKYVIHRIGNKMGQTFREIEVPPSVASIDDFLEVVFH